MLKFVVVRSLIKNGDAFEIVLPVVWVKMHGLKAKQKIFISYDSSTELTVSLAKPSAG